MSEPLERELSPGTIVGGYRLERVLGQGAMGTVYAATEARAGARAAVKVLRRAFADDPVVAARFAREVRAVGEIHHPGVIEVFGAGALPDGRPYFAMPLLEGRSLREELTARERLPPGLAWRIARDVAEALAAVHAAGVIHRDLKPDNVFLERDDHVRVLDFGIAKLEAPAQGEPMKLTATGVPVGTPAYMAPEQWWGAGVSARTDQYALGAMLFEMLSGRPPFTSQSFAEIVQQHVHQPPPSLATTGVAVPPEVEALLARLLSKAPEDRFASMLEVIEAGDQAFLPVGVVSTATPTERRMAPRGAEAERPLRRYVAMHLGILVLGLAGLWAVGYAGRARHDPREWWLIGGGGQHLNGLLLIVAAYGLVRSARRRAVTGQASLGGFWLALLPALTGAFATYAGWNAILVNIPKADALDRFVIFCGGTHEANANRFLGFGLASILCVSLAALPGVSGMARATTTLSGALGVRRREAMAASGGLLVLAVAAALLGAPSGTYIAGTCAAALMTSAALPTIHADTAARDELERAVAGMLAVLLAVAVGVTRVEAREAVLWEESPTRAVRVAEILATRVERDATLVIAAASLAVFAVVEGLRVRRLLPLGALRRPRTATATLATVLAVTVTGDVVQHGRFIGKRDELRGVIASQFALFARLDPPPGDRLERPRFAPHRAAGMQVTRDVVAVDGHGVARLAAVESPEGAAHVVAELNRALARAALSEEAPAVADLSISVDREVKGATLLRLLQLARGAGARRVEVLLTRGPSPAITAGGPPEVGIVVPGDFVALPIELGDDGAQLAAEERFGELAPALIEEALQRTPVQVAVR